MKKNDILKRITKIVLILFVVMAIPMHTVKAAAFGVSAQNNGNGTLSVFITGECAGKFSISVSGQSQIVFKQKDANTGAFSNAQVNFTVGAGTFQVNVTALDVADANYQPVTGSSSTTVTVTVPNSGGGNSGGSGGGSTPSNPSGSGNGNEATPPTNTSDGKSSEASLSSLTVSEGKLNPAFHEDTTNYDLGLTSDITTLEIKAKAKDSKATVSGVGKHDLKVGKNELNVTVTAENGSIKTYAIHVLVDEKPKTFVKYNGKKLGILTNINEVNAPEGFSKTDVKLNGKKIPGFYNSVSKISLVYLADENMIKNFYMVEDGKVTSIYKPIQLFGKAFVEVDVPEVLQTKKGMKYTTLTIDNQKIKGWKFDDHHFKNYYLIYVMDTNGKVKYYQYELSEQSLQLYSGAAPVLASEYEKRDQSTGNKMITYGGIASSVVLAGVIIYMHIRNKKNVEYLMTQRRANYKKVIDESDNLENE